MVTEIGFSNYFKLTHKREGKIISERIFPNAVTNIGKTHSLDATFLPATTQQTWYLGLLMGTGTVSATDTMASHIGWDEFVDYTNATRWAWGPDSAAAQSITNSVSVDYAVTDSGTLKGAFLTSENTKGGTTGILFATALDTLPINVLNGDTLNYTYTVSLV